MNRILHGLFIIFSLFLCKIVAAQEYVPFPTDSNYQWGQEFAFHQDEVGDTVDDYIESFGSFHINGDTTICGKDYNKLWMTGGNLIGAIREENKKIYYFGFEAPNLAGFLAIGAPLLLYDFNANVGDTVLHVLADSTCLFDSTSLFYNDMAIKNVITSIDSIQLLDGSFRKRFHTSGGDWVEGIGNVSKGLLYDITFDACTCTSFHTYEFTCFTNNANGLYLNSNYENCDTKKNISSVSNIPNDANFSIYPNPVTNGNNLNIYNKSQQTYQLKVVDLLGRTLLVNNLKPGNNSILLNQNVSTQLLQVLIYDQHNRLVNSNKIIVN